jgi:hypothetical protein
MPGAEEEDALVIADRLRHMLGNLQQRGALFCHHACLEFAHGLNVPVKSSRGECSGVSCHHSILG